MNIANIKSIAEIFSSHGLTVLEINEGETKIRLEKEISGTALQEQHPAVTQTQAQAVPEKNSNDQLVDFNHLTEVKSPLVGVFYSAASPDSETFVSVGSKVKKGDVLCIIETMKLMNEILAEQDGEIVDVCVKNGDIAEYGQVLFKIF